MLYQSISRASKFKLQRLGKKKMKLFRQNVIIHKNGC